MVLFLACCAHHSSGGAYVTAAMEDRSATQVQKEEYEHLAEPHVERLYEVARPRHVVSQERRPALAVASG